MKKINFTVPAEEVTRVKGLGFLKDKTTENKFNARVITRNGKITSGEARVIAEAAEKFGSGELAFTTRQTVEVQAIPFENIDPFIAFLKENNLEVGGTGPRVRPIVSCKGTTCQYGLIDTYGLSMEIHKRFYLGYHSVTLPHKFKISVGGCPNNCVKPDLNDLGIIGCVINSVDKEKCKACKKCFVEEACPVNAAKLTEDKIAIDDKECNKCGRCNEKCPFGAVKAVKNGYRVLVGGRWGKRSACGREIGKIFETEDEVLNFVEKAILYFKAYGVKGERFADTITRIGFEKAEKELLSNAVIENKEEILKK